MDTENISCSAGAPSVDSELLNQCSQTETINCLFDKSPGHCDVTIVLGGTNVNVTAESRRFFAQSLNAPESTCIDFTVNVRDFTTPRVDESVPE